MGTNKVNLNSLVQFFFQCFIYSMPQDQEVLHIYMIKLTLVSREKKENYRNVNVFRALHVFNAFLFVPRDSRII